MLKSITAAVEKPAHKNETGLIFCPANHKNPQIKSHPIIVLKHKKKFKYFKFSVPKIYLKSSSEFHKAFQ